MGDLAHLEHYLVFRYEDFVGDPQFYIDEVCKFAGLDPIELAETVENHNPTYFSQWAEARRFEDRMLRDYFAENLAVYGEFGYSIDPPWVKPVEARFLARSNSGS